MSERRRHGALRDEVLGLLLHADEPMTARQVAGLLAGEGDKAPALTTVLTVLDRLHRGGEFEKHRTESGELTFAVARHEAEDVAGDMLEALLRSKDRTGALLSFAGNLTADDLRALRDLVPGEDGPEDPS